MRKLISIVLAVALSLFGLAGCSSSRTSSSSGSSNVSAGSSSTGNVGAAQRIDDIQTIDIQFESLSDPDLHRYIEDAVYTDLVRQLDSNQFFVENVEAAYVSKEYLDELAYNTQSNIYFGYTLSEIEEVFQGEKYIFTLDENGQTTVKTFEGYDDTYNRVVRNVAIGGGVILVCVTVSVVTGGTAPAVSMIFAASAKTGTIAALSFGTIAGTAVAIITGVQTGDVDQALKSAALHGSEFFMLGAIAGAIGGGAHQASILHGLTLNGLTMNEAALIQKEALYPLDVIKQFSSMEQYEICKDAGLVPKMVDGKIALIRDIDLNLIDDMGRTNLERMKEGLAALDPTGKAYELHHIGQKVDSTLAILTQEEHRLGENYKILHTLFESEVHAAGNDWAAQRAAFWQFMAEVLA